MKDELTVELRERIASSRYDSGLDGWWAGRVEKVLDRLDGVARICTDKRCPAPHVVAR